MFIFMFVFLFPYNDMSRTRWNTELVAEKMKEEQCTLIDEYQTNSKRITYRYDIDGQTYTVRWLDWLNKKKPSRPHLNGGNRNTKPHEKWDNEKVNEIFLQEQCELADEYKNAKQRLRYKYKNSYYWVTLDDWLRHKARPHLNTVESEQKFRNYLEEHNINFITQKTFDDLKSANNYKLRFDFYLPDQQLLVEVDDITHIYNKKQIEKGKIKDEYCEKHNMKLLRIDATSTPDEYAKALTLMNETNLYVMKYGKLYTR